MEIYILNTRKYPSSTTATAISQPYAPPYSLLFNMSLQISPDNTTWSITQSQTQSLKLKVLYVGIACYPLPQCLLTKHVSFIIEPTCFSEAFKHHQWHTTMDIESNALVRNDTWDLVPPKPSHNLVGNKWISSSHGVDYTKTFSLVVKTWTIYIRSLLSLAIARQLSIR